MCREEATKIVQRDDISYPVAYCNCIIILGRSTLETPLTV